MTQTIALREAVLVTLDLCGLTELDLVAVFSSDCNAVASEKAPNTFYLLLTDGSYQTIIFMPEGGPPA